MPSTRPHFLAITVLSAATLTGCMGANSSSTGSGTETKTVDEQSQAIDRAVTDLGNYCGAAAERRRARGRSSRERDRRRALRAVETFVRIAHRYDKADYAEQWKVRKDLAFISTQLERSRCLPEQSSRIDRFLRQMTLPEPPPEPADEAPPEEPDNSYPYP